MGFLSFFRKAEPIKLTNTLSRTKEVFYPLSGKKVKIYQCGPTVYWTQHIGNLRAMVMADLVVRTLKYTGYDTTFVRNYTDVGHLASDEDAGEDKIEKAARKEQKTPKEIADFYTAQFEADTKALNITEPNAMPKATEYVAHIIDLVQILLDKGYAYRTDNAIYFDVSKAKDYTKLSHQNLEKNRAGAGAGEVEDVQKKHPYDFALWFFHAGMHANALQYWPSPFTSPLVANGEGFPGWHIECSAMIKEILGTTIDIHIGGVEHIPVHHTNEIAQSESANAASLARYWLHNEHLTANGEKMSKSTGTGFALSEIVAKGYSPMALRYFFLQAHYRSKQNFTWEALDAAASGYKRLLGRVSALQSAEGGKGTISSVYKKQFIQAIADDFNLSKALAVVSELFKSPLSPKDKLATVLDFDRVLGLDLLSVLKK